MPKYIIIRDEGIAKLTDCEEAIALAEKQLASEQGKATFLVCRIDATVKAALANATERHHG